MRAPQAREGRNAGMSFIFITLLIDVIGFGIVIPVMPGLVRSLNETNHTGFDSAKLYGALLMVYGLMQFLCAPIFGNLSDRFGRRPVLLLSLLFTGFDYVIQAMAPNIYWLFAGRILSGITGASFTAAAAYIADVSPPEKRAQNFGMMGMAFGVGFIIGPAIGGLLGTFGHRVPFWGAAVFCLLNFLYGWFVLPESLSEENRRPFNWVQVNPFKSLAILGRSKFVLALGAVAGMLWLAQQVPPTSWVLYTEYRMHWGPSENGIGMAFIGVCSMVVQMVVIRQLSPRLGDSGMLWFALLFNFIGFCMLGSSTNMLMMLTSSAVWSLCFVGGPAIQSLVAHQFDATEQGAAQGSLTAIQSLAGVIGPPLYATTFSYFTSNRAPFKVPGSPFYLGALLTIVAAILAKSAISHLPASKDGGPGPVRDVPTH